MRSAVRFSLIIALVLCLCGRAEAQKPDTLTILHLNDTHSNLAPIGPRDAQLEGAIGGIARAAAVIAATRRAEKNVLTLHAGDFSVGDIFYNSYFAIPELKMFQQMGIDAITLGNHEFDITPALLVSIFDTAFAVGRPIPILSANLVLTDPKVLPLRQWVQSSITRQFGNTKVGIFGLTPPLTNFFSLPAPAVVDSMVIADAMTAVSELQSVNCDIIICLSHLGAAMDEELALSVPGINIIVGGLDHKEYYRPMENIMGDTTWMVQADAFYTHIGRLKISRSGSTVKILEHEIIPLDAAVQPDPAMQAAVRGMQADIEQKMQIPFFSRQVTVANGFFAEEADSLLTRGFHDTPIGNLVTDAFRDFGKTDIAIEPGGSTAQPLYPGPITYSDIFRVVGFGFNTVNGFGFRLVSFSMTGAALAAWIEEGLRDIDSGDEFLLQSSGLDYAYDPRKPAGHRFFSARVAGQPLDSARTYTVTANEFMPKLLTRLGIPYTGLRAHGDSTEFMVLAAWIDRFPGGITPIRRPSVIAPVETESAPVASSLDLGQNYPNPFGRGAGSGSATVAFALPSAAHATIRIYDLLGREAGTILDADLEAGGHLVRFTAPALPSGTYLYRLEAGGAGVTRKMILLN